MTKKQLLKEIKECKKEMNRLIDESMVFSMETYADEPLRYASEQCYEEIRRLANRINKLNKQLSSLPKDDSLFQRLKKRLGL